MKSFAFRKATEKDLKTATALIEQAKVFLRENGVDQWQTGYPNEEAIAGDLQRGEGYVCLLYTSCCQKTAVFQQFHGTQVDFPIAFGGIFYGASGLCESGRVKDDDIEFLAFFFQFRQKGEYVTALEAYSVFQSVQFGVFCCLCLLYTSWLRCQMLRSRL